MNPKPCFCAVLLVLLLVSACASGGTVSVSGTYTSVLDGSDGSFTRPDTSGLMLAGITAYYEVMPFRVTASGMYTLTMLQASFSDGGTDGFFVLYQGTFNPLNPIVNVISVNDDQPSTTLPLITATLNPGVDYVLVTTTYGSSITGAYTNSLTGPGSIVFSAPPVFQPNPPPIYDTFR